VREKLDDSAMSQAGLDRLIKKSFKEHARRLGDGAVDEAASELANSRIANFVQGQLENATGYLLESRFPNIFAMVKDLVHVMGVARTQVSRKSRSLSYFICHGYRRAAEGLGVG
jgi:hypothetical protein